MFAYGGGRIRIETERLILCPWEAHDWREFRAIAADPEVMRYIGDGMPWPEERARQFVERQMSLFDERRFCLWKLALKDSGLIGFCGLQPLPESEEIEIGWWLARAWWAVSYTHLQRLVFEKSWQIPHTSTASCC